MSEAGFITPQMLWLLAVIPPLWMLSRYFERVRIRRLQLLGQTAEPRGSLLLLSAAACFILALSRPFYGKSETQVPVQAGDLYIALDVSASMLAQDVKPDRLSFAKRKILDLLSLPQVQGAYRIGLVLFGGEAYLYCPPTLDYGVLELYVNSIDPDLVSSSGSSLQNALEAAVASAEESQSATPRVLLISDGEDTGFNPEELKAMFRGRSLRVDALGVGTTEGKPIPQGNGGYVRDKKGNIVVSHLREKNLETLAKAGSGFYTRAVLDGADLAALFEKANLSSPDASKQQRIITTYRELGPVILALPLLLLLFSAVKARQELICLTLFLWVLSSPLTINAEEKLSGYRAIEKYDSGDYKSAAQAFAGLLQEQPQDYKAALALGNSLYRLGEFPQAAEAYTKAIENASVGREKFEALYNRGNARLQSKRYQEAIIDYEAALKIKSRDTAATFNLELAKQLLKKEEEQKQEQKNSSQEKQQQDKSEAQNNSEQSQDQKQQDSQSSSSPEEKNSQQTQPPQDKANSENQHQTGEEPKPAPQPDQQAKSSSDNEAEHQSRENEGKDSENPAQQTGSSAHDKTPLDQQEAQRWIESLSESPLLLRRQVGNQRKGNQEQAW